MSDRGFIVAVIVSLLMIIIMAISEEIRMIIRILIRSVFFKFLDVLGLSGKHKSYAKKLLNQLKVITRNSEVIEAEQYDFKKKTSIDRYSEEWGVLYITPFEKREKTLKSLIIQIPQTSMFLKERQVIEAKYQIALFDALAFQLAKRNGLELLANEILQKHDKDGTATEFSIIRAILSDTDKFALFMEELRRRYSAEFGSISQKSREEFSEFIKSLGVGKYVAIPIGSYTSINDKVVDIEKRLKEGFDGVYAFARGTNIIKLKKIKQQLSKNPKIMVTESQIYDWTFLSGEVSKGQYFVAELRVKSRIKK